MLEFVAAFRGFRSVSCRSVVIFATVLLGSTHPALGLAIDPNPLVSESTDLDGNLLGRSTFEVLEVMDGLPTGSVLLVGSPSGDVISLVFRLSVSVAVVPGPSSAHVGHPSIVGAGRIPGAGVPIVSVFVPVSVPGLADGLQFSFSAPLNAGESTELFFVVLSDLTVGDQIFAPGRFGTILTVVPAPTVGLLVLSALPFLRSIRSGRLTRGCS